MGRARSLSLIRAVLLAGAAIAAQGWLAGPARAIQSEAEMCATQAEHLANRRIAACTEVIESKRLRGEPLGVAYALRGLAYLDRADIPHAIGDLNQAVTLAPDFAPAYQNRGNAWYARGNYGEALADYERTIELDPDTPSPYVNRGTVRRELGYVSGALDDFNKALKLDPRHTAAYRARGELYLQQQDYARAVADFDAAVS